MTHRLRVIVTQYFLTHVQSGMTPVLSASSHFLIASASGESSNSVVTFVSLDKSSSLGLAIIVVTIVVVLLSGIIIVVGGGLNLDPGKLLASAP